MTTLFILKMQKQTASKLLNPGHCQSGMTLIELLIVISLMAGIFAVALPQFNLKTGTEAAVLLSRLQQDIRTAFEQSVLQGETYRLVFTMDTGEYKLEVADRRLTFVPYDEKEPNDLSDEQEKDRRDVFEQQFKELKEIAGEAIPVPDTDKKVAIVTPVLKAHDRLRPVKWKVMDDLEWRNRSLGPNYLLWEMQADHHPIKQILPERAEGARVMLYIFPNGRMEKAYLKIVAKKANREQDETIMPYIIKVDPYSGTSDLISTDEEQVKDSSTPI